jgi:hypothetical protein
LIVKTIFVPVHKYDIKFACICIASIRHWYPEIEISLIKDYTNGDFNINFILKKFNVNVLITDNKYFGWGYSKLEPIFLNRVDNFLVLDSDTVLTGPILNAVKNINTDFVVDDEVQTVERFNQIYYNLTAINNIEPNFKYPGYSFNSGQWFGSFGKLNKEMFKKYLLFNEPPVSKFPNIIFNGDQSVLNFVLHKSEQDNLISISRINLMIWPVNGNADFIDLIKIKINSSEYPFVIHWAGIKHKLLKSFPRADILLYFNKLFFSRFNIWQYMAIKSYLLYIDLIRNLKTLKQKFE